MSLRRMGGVVTNHTLLGIEYRVIDFNGRTSLHIPLNQSTMANRPQDIVLQEVQDHFLSIEQEHYAEHTELSFSQPDSAILSGASFLCVDLQVTPYGKVPC